MIRFDESRETYDSTNPRFGIEYSNIRIRSNKNAVHWGHVRMDIGDGPRWTNPLSGPTLFRTPRPCSDRESSPTKVRLRSPEYDNSIPQIPDQPTIPKSPAYSGDSIESTEEDNDDWDVNRHSTYNLGGQFRDISWPSFAKICRLRCSWFLVSNESIKSSTAQKKYDTKIPV